MLKELVVRKYAGRVLYVHNLAGFDSRFILAALGDMTEFKVKLMGRAMNEIFYIKISRVIKLRSASKAGEGESKRYISRIL
jgi:hypothetical protein